MLPETEYIYEPNEVHQIATLNEPFSTLDTIEEGKEASFNVETNLQSSTTANIEDDLVRTLFLL